MSLPQILIVEPHPGVASALQTVLAQMLNVETRLAVDPDQVAELVADQVPDLIIVDAATRQFNALSLVANLKGAPSTCGVPIIALVVDGLQRELARAVGCDHLLPLPFRIADFLCAVHKYLDVEAKPALKWPAPQGAPSWLRGR